MLSLNPWQACKKLDLFKLMLTEQAADWLAALPPQAQLSYPDMVEASF